MPQDHPLRLRRAMTDEALRELQPRGFSSPILCIPSTEISVGLVRAEQTVDHNPDSANQAPICSAEITLIAPPFLRMASADARRCPSPRQGTGRGRIRISRFDSSLPLLRAASRPLRLDHRKS